MKKVLIIQAVVKHYRLAFFEQLHRECEKRGVALSIAYSLPDANHAAKGDNVFIDSAYGKCVRNTEILGGRMYFQHCLRAIMDADLVIVEQANRPLINLILIVLRLLRLKRFAYWGHGRNLQANSEQTLSERIKHRLLRLPNWWFAYTANTKDYLVEHGVSPRRITDVNNSIDTTEFNELLARVTDRDKTECLNRLDIPLDATIGLYCGSLYKEKCLPLLLDSIKTVRSVLPDFHLIVCGDGPDRALVEASALPDSGIHFLGPLYGKDKAIVFSLAQGLLNPGLVGLGILDGFVAGLPMFTTYYDKHSPEISYLEDGVNGALSEHASTAFAKMVIHYYRNPNALVLLSEGALVSKNKYSVEQMALNFASGISEAIKRP